MPGLRPCLEPYCPVLVRTGRCTTHSRPAWASAQPVPRIRGARLQAMRERLFQHHPLCHVCLAKTPPCFSASAIRDHVVPLAEGGLDDETNEQALCVTCHQVKTQQEAQRGRRALSD